TRRPLATRAPATVTSSTRPRAGSSAGYGSPTTRARIQEPIMRNQAGVARRFRFAEDSSFATDVLAGLTARPKRLSPKYFYDEAGSRLFEQITELPEYYPPRCHLPILPPPSPPIPTFPPPQTP